MNEPSTKQPFHEIPEPPLVHSKWSYRAGIPHEAVHEHNMLMIEHESLQRDLKNERAYMKTELKYKRGELGMVLFILAVVTLGLILSVNGVF